MQSEHLIRVETFCVSHNIEVSFISALHELGIIEMVNEEKDQFINDQELRKLEQIVRLHYDLEINPEGIEVILDLLQRIEDTQREIDSLKNRLRIFEINS